MTLQWLVLSLIGVVALALLVAFLNRFYRKASREYALIRTGLGGKKIVIDGGCLTLPFLHRVDEINMRTMRLIVRRANEKSLLTADRMRVNLTMEFHLRVLPTADGIAAAAQALGAKSFRAENLQALFEGKFVDAMQTACATRTMDDMHEQRGEYGRAVAALLKDNITASGLDLESVSLTDFDQTPPSALDENNAFNAVGMRRLAEIVSENRQKRVTIEADTDLAVRQTQLAAIKRRLTLEKEQEEAQLAQALEVATLRASTEARQKEAEIRAQLEEERCRLDKSRELKLSEIEKEQTLRRQEIDSLLDVERHKVDSQVALAEKRLEEIAAQTKTEQAGVAVLQAQEATQTERALAVAERERQLSVVRARQEAEIAAIRADGDNREKLTVATTALESERLAAEGVRVRAEADAAGRRLLAEAENAESDAVRRARLERHKVDTLPLLAERLAKPMEKVDSIRINQISGVGGEASGGNTALDGVLNLALQLPAIKKLGESIGVNIDAAADAPPVEKTSAKADAKSGDRE